MECVKSWKASQSLIIHFNSSIPTVFVRIYDIVYPISNTFKNDGNSAMTNLHIKVC